jgi:ABC-type multidrug transport system fused ATPase/permease subunit
MNDFFSKLENFFFDILGLILPGAIFLLILLSPVLLVDMAKMEKAADTSVILSALVTIWNILKAYWASNPKSALTIVTILAYLIGHMVKVFSIIKYEFLTAFFDKCVNKIAVKLYNKVIKMAIEIYNKVRKWVSPPKPAPIETILSARGELSSVEGPSSPVAPPAEDPYRVSCKDLFKPFKALIEHIFIFKPAFYHNSDEPLRQNCLDNLNASLDIRFPDDDHSIVKMSSVITNQEGLRSLGTFFLAKYNLYRSLALIFLFTTFYYFWFFKIADKDDLLSKISQEVSGFMLVAPIILWFTFHVKYKRYWTLYGGERILTLFYFLNKKKINERG